LTLLSKLTTIVLEIDYNVMDVLKLKNSKTREKILKLFFLDTEKKYYLRELERILNLPVGNIRRELLSLEKTGLFKRQEMGKQVYYSLNKDSSIFEEFKRIVSKTIGVERVLGKDLMKIPGLKIAFLYGSFAKNRENSLSDIDLFIIGKVDEDELIKFISRAENELSREINYVIFSESDLREKLKGEDIFLTEVVSGKKIFLIGNENELEKIIK